MCKAANPRLTLCQDNAHKTDKTTPRLCRENLPKQKKERPSTPQCGRHCMQVNGKRHAYGMQYISFCKAKGLFSQRKTMVFTAFLTMFHGLSAVILMHSLWEYGATYYKTSHYVCTHFCGYLRPDVFYFRTTQLWSVMQKTNCKQKRHYGDNVHRKPFLLTAVSVSIKRHPLPKQET